MVLTSLYPIRFPLGNKTDLEGGKHVIEAVGKWALSLLQAGKVAPSSFSRVSAYHGHGYTMIEGRVPAPVVRIKDLATDSIFREF